MRTALLIALGWTCGISSALGGATTRPAKSTGRKAGGRARPGRKAADLCRGAIDPYDAAGERTRFFAAAGADGEMNEKEFRADRKKPAARRFVRSFDRWPKLKGFDKNGNRTVDWFEAEAYRKHIRKRVLAAFDTNRDGRLTGKERAAANRSLRGGRIQPRRAGPSGWFGRQRETYETRMLRKYDDDGDGKLSEEEMKGAFQEMGRQQKQKLLEKHDLDGDGKLSDEERKAMYKQQNQPWREGFERLALRDFDADGDGKIDEQEREEVNAFGRKLGGVMQQFNTRIFDLDGDGKVTSEERREVGGELRKSMWKMMIRFSTYMDTDGNGQVTPDEMRSFGGRMQKSMLGWVERYSLRHDLDNNGRLGEGERAKLLEDFRSQVDTRITKFDANQDGRLDADEIMNLSEDFLKEIGMAPRKPTTQPKPSKPPT